MKFWKKIAAVLSVTFAFSSFAACDGGKSNSANSSGNEVSSEESFEQESSIPETEATKQMYNVDVDMKLAQTQEGLDMQISCVAPEEMSGGVRLVDGYLYMYSMEDGVWTQGSSKISAEENTYLFTIMETLAGSFEEMFGQEATSATLTLSYKNEVNAVLDYIGKLNKQTPLVKIVDDMLAPMDTSVADIKNYIIDNQVGLMTVGQIHENINAYIAENTEYADIDEAVDYLLSDEQIASIVAMMFEGEVTVEELIAVDVDAQLDEFADVTVDELITSLFASMEDDTTSSDSSYEEDTKYDVQEEVTSDMEEEVTLITLEELITELEMTLQTTTLGDMIDEEAEIWTMIAMCSATNVTKCDITIVTEATFGKLSSESLLFVLEAEMVAGEEKVEIALNLTLDIEIVESIEVPSDVVCYCYECSSSNLEDATVKARDNGYVLCDECTVSFEWEYCVNCWEKKEDCVYREDLEDYYCDDCYQTSATPVE